MSGNQRIDLVDGGRAGPMDPVVRRWVRLSAVQILLPLALGVLFSLIAWLERAALFPDGPSLVPSFPVPGTGPYGTSMVGTIGELVEKHELRGKRLAVWGGDLAEAHNMPFRYRISVDWFLLPEKGVTVLATPEQVAGFDFLLSPWDVAWTLRTAGVEIEVLADSNWVWLYRVLPPQDQEADS